MYNTGQQDKCSSTNVGPFQKAADHHDSDIPRAGLDQ